MSSETQSKSQPAVLKKVKDLWFEDGTVIIEAESKLFRLHKSLLAARSTVFGDMFTFPQPVVNSGEDSDYMDGCPIVRIHDAAEDAYFFFLSIYYSGFFESYPSKTELRIILAVARASHKYGVPYLLRRALKHLASGYPLSLSELDQREKLASFDIKTTFEEVLQVIQTALEINALWILPIAYYELNQRSLPEMFGSPKWADWSGTSGKMAVLLFGRDKTAFANSVMMEAVYESLSDCSSSKICNRYRLAFLKESLCWKIHSPLDAWKPEWARQLCTICLSHCTKSYDLRRADFMEELPEIYGLPSIDELQTMEEAVVYQDDNNEAVGVQGYMSE